MRITLVDLDNSLTFQPCFFTGLNRKCKEIVNRQPYRITAQRLLYNGLT